MRPLHFRFGVVLGLILASISFSLAAPTGDWARLVTVALEGATLVSAVVASRAHRWVIGTIAVATVLLIAAAGVAVFGSSEFGADSSRVVSLLLVTLAGPAIVTGLIKHFRVERRLTLQSVWGVLCLYLLLGLLFGSAFAAVQELSNDAFFATGFGNTQDFIYFSFTTITTTGYGDLTADTNLGRSLAITEALSGQIYLVAVVGLIVGNLRPAGGRKQA
jgi:hypothetical protein